jgi:glycosyltransferase involved in cell wall biosynthesis
MATASVDPAAIESQLEPAARQKYLFFAPWGVRPGSGVNNAIMGLLGALKRDYEPEIVVTGWGAPPPDQFWVKLPPVTARLRQLFGFLYRLIPNAVRLIRLARGAVAVNPHYFGTEVLPLIWLRKLGLIPRVILSVHGADVTEAASLSNFERKIYDMICRGADVVIACSGALAEEVRRLSPGANVVTVWNGVSAPPEHFGPRPIARPYLVSVAGFVRKKGHDVLIEAFRQIAPEFPDLQLELIGRDGPERERAEHQIRAAGLEDRVHIRLDLDHDRIWNWVHHAECFVHAARAEPFGIAILEAGLAHTPVVTTAVGGIREYLAEGSEGLTCEPDNPDQLAERIRQTLRDPARARARANAFYRKASRFTWQKAWEGYRKYGFGAWAPKAPAVKHGTAPGC